MNKKKIIKYTFTSIVALLFLFFTIYGALGTWTKPLGNYLGVSYLASYWEGNEDNNTYISFSNTNLTGNVIQSIIFYDEIRKEELIVTFDVVGRKLKVFNHSQTLIDEFSCVQEDMTIRSNLVIPSWDINDITIIFLTGNITSTGIYMLSWNESSSSLYMEGCQNLTNLIENELIYGTDLICDNGNIEACYFMTNNYTFVSINMSDPNDILVHETQNANDNSNCSTKYYMNLYHSLDIDGDSMREVVVPSNDDCDSGNGTNKNNVGITLFTLNNINPSIYSKDKVVDDLFKAEEGYEDYIEMMPKCIMWDYNGGDSEVYCMGAKAIAVNSSFLPYLISMDIDLTENWNRKMIGNPTLSTPDNIFYGMYNAKGVFTQPTPVLLDEDNLYEICVGYSGLDFNSPSTYTHYSSIQCITGDNTYPNDTDFGVTLKNSPSRVSYDNTDINHGKHLLIIDIDNDNDWDFFWGDSWVFFYNSSFDSWTAQDKVIYNYYKLIVGADTYEAESGWIASDMNLDGNPELYGIEYDLKNLFQITQSYTNQQPYGFSAVLFDTASPICFGEVRTYYDPFINDNEGDNLKMKVICGGDINLDTGWSEISSNPQRSCNYSEENGFALGTTYQDTVIITDASHPNLETVLIKCSYTLGFGGCVFTDEKSGVCGREVIITSNFTSYGLNETWVEEGLPHIDVGNYTSQNFDFNGSCSEWTTFYSICPVFVIFEEWIEDLWLWFWEVFRYLLIIIVIVIVIFMSIKKNKK